VVQEQVRQEVQSAKPEGLVDLDEFDSTLYFLDEIEIAALRGQVEKEYARDTRIAALAVMFDIFELQADPDIRAEIVGVLESLFPNLLVRGDFHTLANILRELRALRTRRASTSPRSSGRRVRGPPDQPETIAQLLQSLDEATTLPPEDELGEVLRELRAPALGTILNQIPRLASAECGTIGVAAERLAMGNTAELLRLLRSLEPDALPGAVRLAGRLGLQAAVQPVAELVRHEITEIRLAAVEVLALLGTPGAMTGLEPAIDDADRTVRVAAVAGGVEAGLGRGARAGSSGGAGQAARTLETAPGVRGVRRRRGAARARTLRACGAEGMFQRKASTEVRTCAVYALGSCGPRGRSASRTCRTTRSCRCATPRRSSVSGRHDRAPASFNRCRSG
jgi:hypothetical protein